MDFPRDVQYIRGDLNRREHLNGLFDKQEYVFHLAGAKGGVGIGQNRAADFMRGNLICTLNLFDELVLEKTRHPQSFKRLLFTSSVGAYPGNRDVFHEYEDIWSGAPHNSDFFGGVAKRTGEALCDAHRQQFGIDCVIVRPTNCFGPYDRFDAQTGMVIAALIARLEAGENPLVVWGDGRSERDFLYSKDCASQMITAMTRGRSGEAYNLGTGETWSILGIARTLTSLRYPDVSIELDRSKPSGPRLRKMNVRKIRALDEERFSLCNFHRVALTETVDWYRANKNAEKFDPFKEKEKE